MRIGYAGGSRSHQRDFAVAAEALANVLRERSCCRLVLFRFQIAESTKLPFLDIEEFPSFRGIEDQIEWRTIVPLPQLPEEMVPLSLRGTAHSAMSRSEACTRAYSHGTKLPADMRASTT